MPLEMLSTISNSAQTMPLGNEVSQVLDARMRWDTGDTLALKRSWFSHHNVSYHQCSLSSHGNFPRTSELTTSGPSGAHTRHRARSLATCYSAANPRMALLSLLCISHVFSFCSQRTHCIYVLLSAALISLTDIHSLYLLAFSLYRSFAFSYA
jgi:hypothetical protein